MVSRGDRDIMLPEEDLPVELSDRILFCGTRHARHLLHAAVNNPYTLHYLVTGEDSPRSWFFQWLQRRMGGSEEHLPGG